MKGRRGSGRKVARDYNGKYVRNEVKGVGSREPRRSLGGVSGYKISR